MNNDNINIKSISSYLVSETINNKRNVIFISKDENPLIRPFKDITDVVIHVNTLSKKKLNCVIKVYEGGVI